MTDHAGFIAAILADPDADDVRLIYADWLEDHEQSERAEFIRVQVELAKFDVNDLAAKGMSKWPTTAAWHSESNRLIRLHAREIELSCLDRRDWMGAAKDIVPNGARFDDHLTWCRGFVESLACSAADWFAHADAITACQPVRAVTLTTRLSLHETGFCYAAVREKIILDAALRNGANRQNYPPTWDDGNIVSYIWPGITFTVPPSPYVTLTPREQPADSTGRTVLDNRDSPGWRQGIIGR